jgi:hypothetical protein
MRWFHRSLIAFGFGILGLACSSSTSSGSSGALQAPMMTGVAPMAGALHVTWMNMQSDCDTVEGERKSGTGAYAAAFSVPGSVDNKMDTAATSNMTYTFRLRCNKGGTFSAYSNEMTGNPMSSGDAGMNMDGGMDSGMAMDSGMNMDSGMHMDGGMD